MYRIIGGDGREYGPVSAPEIEQWIAQRRANGDTRIKLEGAIEWTTLRELPDFAAALAAQVAPPPIPGASVPPPMAPAADPAAFARPSASAPETAPPGTPGPAAASARARVGRDYQLSVFESLSRGWDIVASRFWLVVGGCFVSSLVNGVAGSLPLVGILSTILLTQVFYAGIFWLTLRVSRGEPAELGDIFVGFNRSLGQLVLLSLVIFFSILVLAMIAMGPLFFVLIRSGIFHGGQPDPAQLIAPALALPFLMIPLIYLSVSWMFAPLLVIDRGLGFWEAMELSRRVVGKRWFRLFFLYLTFIPLAFAGLLCFIVGIFVTSALMYASIVAAYQKAFPDTEQADPSSVRPWGADEPRL